MVGQRVEGNARKEEVPCPEAHWSVVKITSELRHSFLAIAASCTVFVVKSAMNQNKLIPSSMTPQPQQHKENAV